MYSNVIVSILVCKKCVHITYMFNFTFYVCVRVFGCFVPFCNAFSPLSCVFRRQYLSHGTVSVHSFHVRVEESLHLHRSCVVGA